MRILHLPVDVAGHAGTLARRLRFFLPAASRYDVFHDGTSFLPLFADVRMLRARGKTVVMHSTAATSAPTTSRRTARRS